MKLKLSFLLLFLLVLLSCEKDIPDDPNTHKTDTVFIIDTVFITDTVFIEGNGNGEIVNYTITGKVQKGPFRTGSTITVSELTDKFVPTGKNFYSTVYDNFGKFRVPNVELESDFVEIQADGKFYHETFGSVIEERYILKALANLADSTTVNVNLLTHLTFERIKYLIFNEGLSFAEAKLKAQNELLKVFNLEEEAPVNCDYLDIGQGGVMNSKLLAVSVIILGFKAYINLSEYLTNFAFDFETDGTIDTEDIQKTLITSAIFCNTGGVRINMTNLYGVDEFLDFQLYVNEFIEKTKFQPHVNYEFEKETELGINLVALPDNSKLSTDLSYCIQEELGDAGKTLEFKVSIFELEGEGNVEYIENDLSQWRHEIDGEVFDPGSNKTFKGSSMNISQLDYYPNSIPLQLKFKGTGKIKVLISYDSDLRFPDNGGSHFVAKYFYW